jgi:hypothetical protein
MAFARGGHPWGDSSPMFSPKILFLFPKDSVLSLSMLPQQWGVAAQHALGYFALGTLPWDACALQHNQSFKHISINDGQIDVDKIANIMGLIIWAAPSRRTPESAPTSWISSRSIWLNIFFKLFAPHIYFNHTTLMKQSLKTLSLEDLRFPTKCAPKKSALLTEVLKQPLLNMLFNQTRSFLSLFFICSNIWISPTSTPLNNL